MADHREQVCMQVSAGAADLLTFLGEQLLILEQLVSTLLFPALVERVGQGLDQLILTDVSVCVCSSWWNGLLHTNSIMPDNTG